ncbi:hypothetical protein A4A49_02673 [Nicotiana attenuata]|uniref:Uncharacterized protein n=1 Tax=Nicotiana attenuata TaxID=49451 RepID=A0A1J6IBZ4_NICAT|nr:hypothetical protein A4A49_02673 [Nicotiana attenuata]
MKVSHLIKPKPNSLFLSNRRLSPPQLRRPKIALRRRSTSKFRQILTLRPTSPPHPCSTVNFTKRPPNLAEFQIQKIKIRTFSIFAQISDLNPQFISKPV